MTVPLKCGEGIGMRLSDLSCSEIYNVLPLYCINGQLTVDTEIGDHCPIAAGTDIECIQQGKSLLYIYTV